MLSLTRLTSYTGVTSSIHGQFFYALRPWNTSVGLNEASGVIGRNSSGLVGANYGQLSELTGGISGPIGGAAAPYPGVNGGIYLDRCIVMEDVNKPRALLPGVYAPLNVLPFSDFEKVSDLAGLPTGTELLNKAFRSFWVHTSSGDGRVLFDLGAW